MIKLKRNILFISTIYLFHFRYLDRWLQFSKLIENLDHYPIVGLIHAKSNQNDFTYAAIQRSSAMAFPSFPVAAALHAGLLPAASGSIRISLSRPRSTSKLT